MWKFIFFPCWYCELLEDKLSALEQHGLRLVSANLFYFFKFAECKPKKVRYVITYSFFRELGMRECDYFIKHCCKGNSVNTGALFFMNILRITDTNAPFSEVISYRSRYMSRVLLQKICLSFFFGLFLFACAIKLEMIVLQAIFFCGVVLSMAITTYYLIGLFYLLKKR